MTLKINQERLLSELNELAQIGATHEGGVERLAMSEADLEGRAWFQSKVTEAGFAYATDGVANQSATLFCPTADAQTIIAGSHLDTVRNGGRFDGALGVLAALEAARTIKEHQIALPYHLEIINFTDEEGSIMGVLGSQAVAGLLSEAHFISPRGGHDALNAGMARLGISQASILNAVRDPSTIHSFVEIHIEQGTRLEERGSAIGVVTGIVGIRSAEITFYGEAAHAGTMPMDKRRDALWGASDLVQRARGLVMEQFAPGVVNFGQINALPGSYNIVPAQVNIAMEFRHGTEAELDELQAALTALIDTVAADFNLGVDYHINETCLAAPANDLVIDAIESAADRLALSHTRLLSFAGHDTQSMSMIVPSGMFFVPSVDGISHNPREFTRDEDVVNAGNVMLHAILALAGVSL